jgi:hypothetical protein
MKVVRLPVLRTDHLYPLGKSPGTHFCYRLSRPQGHSEPGRIMSIINSNDDIGKRTRDFPDCTAVSQPNAPKHCCPVCSCWYSMQENSIKLRSHVTCGGSNWGNCKVVDLLCHTRNTVWLIVSHSEHNRFIVSHSEHSLIYCVTLGQSDLLCHIRNTVWFIVSHSEQSLIYCVTFGTESDLLCHIRNTVWFIVSH